MCLCRSKGRVREPRVHAVSLVEGVHRDRKVTVARGHDDHSAREPGIPAVTRFYVMMPGVTGACDTRERERRVPRANVNRPLGSVRSAGHPPDIRRQPG